MHILVLVGAGILTFLGVMHGLLTLRSTPTGGPMMPTDSSVQEAMSIEGGLGLAPEIRTTLWKAWIGFNLSHALGVVVVGVVIGWPVIRGMAVPADEMMWVAAALVLPWVYLGISSRYWFRQPTTAIGLAGALITGGIVGHWMLG
ncbi:MAG: hypothetical protein AAGI08_07520 [Bacteroidota bacterium]